MFHTAWTNPSKQIQRPACLVVGSRGSRTSEGLLRDDSTRGFVVDVEIARCESKCIERGLDIRLLCGED